jgi:hypothetical protein
VLPVALLLFRAHDLFGLTEYDDGVYFGASLRLIDGIFPYRDFVFVQPPGITVVLAPFAGLAHAVGGRDAIAAARIVTALVAGANAALVGFLLRRRGLVAVAVGGVGLAVFPTGYTATHTFLLEPYCVCFCLLGAAALFAGEEVASPRRCVLAGACLGFAGAVKVFAVVPLLAILIVLCWSRRSALVPFVIGVAGSLVLFVLPFLVAAPSAFVHDVIASQVGRSTGRPTPVLDRLFALTGLAYASPGLSAAPNVPAVPAGALPTVLASCGIGGIGGIVAIAQWRRPTPFGGFCLLVAAGGVGIAFIPAAYFDHYAYFTAPFLALVLGGGAGLLAHARMPRPGSATVAAGVVTGIVLIAAAAGAVVPSNAFHRTIVDRFGDPGPAIAAVVPGGACTLTDAESILVSAGRAEPGPPGCPAIVDPTGTWLSIDPLHPPVRSGLGPKDPVLVALWAAAFSRAEYVVFSGAKAFRIPWTPALRATFDRRFARVPGTPALVYRART